MWSFTTDKLASEMYTYNVIVDGTMMLDPANVYVNRDVASMTSLFMHTQTRGVTIRDTPRLSIGKMI